MFFDNCTLTPSNTHTGTTTAMRFSETSAGASITSWRHRCSLRVATQRKSTGRLERSRRPRTIQWFGRNSLEGLVVAPSGVEPEHSCEYRNLNPTRLPIPPRGLVYQQIDCSK